MKKSTLKVVALLLCFGFLLTAVPSLNAIEKKAVKLNLNPTVIKSLTTLFPWLATLLAGGSKAKLSTLPSFRGIVKPTGDAPIGKPGTGN